MAVTDWKSPGTVVSDSSVGDTAWTNPSNATTSDNSYTTGIFDYHDWPYEEYAKIVKPDGTIGATNKANTSSYLSSYSDAVINYGGSVDLWGENWTASDINDTDFGFAFSYDDFEGGKISEYLKATNFGFSIPTDATINGIEVGVEYKIINDGPSANNIVMVDHIQIRVYYTESAGTPTVGVKYPLPAFSV